MPLIFGEICVQRYDSSWVLDGKLCLMNQRLNAAECLAVMHGNYDYMTGYTFLSGIVSGPWARYLVVEQSAHTAQMV